MKTKNKTASLHALFYWTANLKFGGSKNEGICLLNLKTMKQTHLFMDTSVSDGWCKLQKATWQGLPDLLENTTVLDVWLE